MQEVVLAPCHLVRHLQPLVHHFGHSFSLPPFFLPSPHSTKKGEKKNHLGLLLKTVLHFIRKVRELK
jgi:hypothetical protein